MKSKITAKFQTMILKKIHEEMKLSINDNIEWKCDSSISVITFDKYFQTQLDQCDVSIEKPV
jgi:hypothetical protein